MQFTKKSPFLQVKNRFSHYWPIILENFDVYTGKFRLIKIFFQAKIGYLNTKKCIFQRSKRKKTAPVKQWIYTGKNTSIDSNFAKFQRSDYLKYYDTNEPERNNRFASEDTA
jgi:hypothetical protein